MVGILLKNTISIKGFEILLAGPGGGAGPGAAGGQVSSVAVGGSCPDLDGMADDE